MKSLFETLYKETQTESMEGLKEFYVNLGDNN